MGQQVLEAEIRTGGGKNASRRLRRAGQVPGVVYGADKEAIPLALNIRQSGALLRSREHRNDIFSLQVQGGESTPVMIVEPQFDPVRGTLLHVDLKRIAMHKKVRVLVSVVPVGEPEGVKIQGGALELGMREVEVECLPSEIPPHLSVPVESLKIGGFVRVADLQQQLGDRIRLLSDPHAMLCHVVTVRAEEPKPAEAVVESAAEPELIRRGKAGEEKEKGSAESREEKE